ncbi:hypothetical protein [Cupriavidus sp. UME77]|nr:hypothetical protein [Cupriavidus sp. UME77]
MAAHVNGVGDTEKHRAPIDTLAGALAVDMADYWTPEPMRPRKAH